MRSEEDGQGIQLPDADDSLIETCLRCGDDLDAGEPGYYKSPDEKFVHRVCFEEGEPKKVLDLYEDFPFMEQVTRMYNCGHWAEGPPTKLPVRCPECEVPAP